MCRRSKRPENTIEAFDKALLIGPGFETARFNKGIEGRIREWEQIVKLNPAAMTPNGESHGSENEKSKVNRHC